MIQNYKADPQSGVVAFAKPVFFDGLALNKSNPFAQHQFVPFAREDLGSERFRLDTVQLRFKLKEFGLEAVEFSRSEMQGAIVVDKSHAAIIRRSAGSATPHTLNLCKRGPTLRPYMPSTYQLLLSASVSN